MGITIGDALAVVSFVVALCLCSWALVLTMSLLFRVRTAAAWNAVESRPFRSFFAGAICLAAGGIASAALAAQPAPAIKVVGIAGYLALLTIAALGASGLVQLVSARIKSLDPSLPSYTSLARAAAIVVIAGALPFLGWFLIAPVVILVSLGAGITALMTKPVAASNA